MCVEVISAKALPNHKLLVGFTTGEKKIFDFAPKLDKPAFQRLKNPVLFSRAKADYSAVIWNDEIDIAAEALYEGGVPA